MTLDGDLDATTAGQAAGAGQISSAELMNVILDNIPQAMFWKDLDLVYRWCNRTFARNAGLDDPQLIEGRTDFDLPWTTSQARAYREMDGEVIATNRAIRSIVERQQYADGRQAWLVTTKVPLHDATGSVLGLLGTYEDVSELYQAKEDLRGLNDRLEERVNDRTAALSLLNERLQQQIRERERAEQAQVHSEAQATRQRSIAEALGATARLLNDTLDLDEVLDRILVTIGTVADHDSASIVLVDRDDLRVARTWSRSGGRNRAPRPPQALTGCPGLQKLAADGAAVISRTPDQPVDWRWLHGTAQVVETLSAAIVAQGTLIGFISLGSERSATFRRTHGKLLTAFADQAATAVRNARLFGQAQALAALEERQRLARDLHDAVSQTLWSASVLVDALLQIDQRGRASRQATTVQLKNLVNGALSEMRTLLWELRPESIVSTPLAELLEELVRSVTSRKLIQIDLSVTAEGRLPPDVHLAVYRVAQESLSNIVRHANAQHVTLSLDHDAASMVMRVVDDGVGFSEAAASGSHFGLRSMQERAHSINAEITVHSETDGGTSVMLTWSREKGMCGLGAVDSGAR